jgi:hypothetical protein
MEQPIKILCSLAALPNPTCITQVTYVSAHITEMNSLGFHYLQTSCLPIRMCAGEPNVGCNAGGHKIGHFILLHFIVLVENVYLYIVT